MFKKSSYSQIFVLTILCLALIPKNHAQAVTSTTYDFYNEFGTRLEVSTVIKDIFPKDGANTIEFQALLEGLRPTAVSLFDIVVNFRIGSHELGSTGLSDLNSVGSEASAETSFDYNSDWGTINLEIQVTWTEEIPSDTDINGSTNWVVVFTLEPGSFFSEYYWILIIAGVVAVAGTIAGVMIYRNRKMSKSDREALEISKQMEEEVMLTSPEKHTLDETQPKVMKFCPHCVAELKGATGTCPNCGENLE